MIFLVSCTNNNNRPTESIDAINQDLLSNYVRVDLNSDLENLSKEEKLIIPILIEASSYIDEIFWLQSIGTRNRVMDSIESEQLQLYADINYGTWDRLNGLEPFVDKFGIKPLGARFYPARMTFKEFEKLDAEDKYDSYTIVMKRNDGSLFTVPYYEAYASQVKKISELLKKASTIAVDKNLKEYLKLRADAFLHDNYYESDMAWMDNTTGNIDFIIGPIEYDEDRLFRAKSAHGSILLVKDKTWTDKLGNAKEYLPNLQKMLPIDDQYKMEEPIISSDLGVYDVIYCAGDFNAGSKKISITLPYDGRVQMEKGSRKLQFKNIMNAKFEKILLPIVDIMIDQEQRKYVNFDAFFENTMYYEIGNCLGCINTINDKGTVKEALKEYYYAMEESKSDILSLFFLTKLNEMNVFTEKDIMENYVTYLADIFRSIRFGAANPQGKANIVRLNYFLQQGAVSKDSDTGMYRLDKQKTKEAIEDFAHKILMIRGDGDYEKAKMLISDLGEINQSIEKDILKITEAGIPKDIYFNQGVALLGY